MTCFICGNEMKFYFRKNFNLPYLRESEYIKCEFCGMVISKTHFEMNSEQWSELNYEQHSIYQGKEVNNEDKNWIVRLQKQSEVISTFYANKIFAESFNAVDYGCGDGKLADMVNRRIKKENWLKKYDKYMNGGGENIYLMKK